MDMSSLLRLVKEADVNQPATPQGTAPAAPQEPPKVDPANYKVPSVEFLKKNYRHPADVIQGASASSSDPTRIGAWAQGSDFDELVMALSGSNYRAAKADPNFRPVQVKDDWEYVQRLLGTPEGKEYAVDNWIGLSDVNDKSQEAEFQRAQQKEFEKQANARILAQKDNVIKPGWKYDPAIGTTPAYQRSQQAAQQPPAAAPVSESKTNRLSTAEQMILNHKQIKETITNPVLNVDKDAKPSMIGKYFKTIEQEFAESAERNKDLAKRLAERISYKINETPIAATDDPNDPMIHGHEKANPMTLKGRISQARNQLTQLAHMAESNDLIVWEQICKLAKGGMFMGLEQNLEQIRHGISELAAKRKKGGVQSRGIEKNIGEGEAYCDACDRVESQCVCNDHKLHEDWQKVNKHDKTDGMSSKAVKAYRRENPGSKLKTAVTTKPSKLKKGSKSAKRRASFCARMSGMKKAHASAKTKRDPDSPINKALRRWNCESIEEMQALIQHAEQVIAEEKKTLKNSNPCWKGYKPVGTKQKGGRTVPNCVPNEEVQKTGPAGQLKGTDKVDVKGTVLGSPEKSQKGLRGKLVGGGA